MNEMRFKKMESVRSSVFMNNEEIVDSSGMQNYVRLSQARPVEAQGVILNQDFPTINIDENVLHENFSKGMAEIQIQSMENDELRIKEIIDKGRFVNKIAKALHEEKADDTKYELRVNPNRELNSLGQLKQ